jgi:hypothetical protein
MEGPFFTTHALRVCLKILKRDMRRIKPTADIRTLPKKSGHKNARSNAHGDERPSPTNPNIAFGFFVYKKTAQLKI